MDMDVMWDKVPKCSWIFFSGLLPLPEPSPLPSSCKADIWGGLLNGQGAEEAVMVRVPGPRRGWMETSGLGREFFWDTGATKDKQERRERKKERNHYFYDSIMWHFSFWKPFGRSTSWFISNQMIYRYRYTFWQFSPSISCNYLLPYFVFISLLTCECCVEVVSYDECGIIRNIFSPCLQFLAPISPNPWISYMIRASCP